MEIRVRETKEGRKAIEIGDLIEALCSWGSDKTEKASLIEKLLLTDSFDTALGTVLGGYSNEEGYGHTKEGVPSSGADEILALFAKHSDTAARELIKRLTERVGYLSNRLVDLKQHREALLDQWPDAFKKYIPQELHTHESTYISDDQVTKMIEHVKTDMGEK